MKKALSVVAAASALALTLGACGAAPEDKSADAGKSTAEGTPKSDFVACMVSDEGGFDDKSFNQSGYEGLKRAEKELGIKIKTAESSNAANFAPNLDKLAAEKCNIIFGVGFMLAEATYNAAKAHPDINYGLIDAIPTDPKTFEPLPALPNLKSLVFNTAEAGFLAGYAAAGTTKTGKVGTYLGMKLPTTAIFADGFADGVAKYNQDKGTNVEVLGWDKAKQDGQATGDFSDQNKGKATTTNLINQGADVIMPVAGPVGAGTLAAVKEANGQGKDVSVVWVDSDGVLTNPDSKDIIMTSVMKQIGEAVFDTIKEQVDGKKFTSDPYIGTIANKGVDIAPFHEFDGKIPDDLKKQIDALREQIASGQLKVESPNSPK
ncbi:BMP family ABC transporter substrate-binding protein [Boudabousia liubingyangii]|uniref:BMP family ABC transporter substrate-binding protein n=1 Tax=Boudabousia liubingyangii TaxID=1921764 RepID=A0A1Q5PJV6_9ACTO|nr:BMP family ABC transporter substrate-binding protein [Boudabousia liubingyangii]OKL46216.1 BMP family ABC transporter substrate-binding protein [Boudabousia liubingyangii]OKL46521.1 BMP family ABC transporter substrate-binding protein [Boudabousia liubingyangii]